MNNIIIVGMADVAPFPRQEEIYGNIENAMEPEFIASVKEQGILTPLLLADSAALGLDIDERYIAISGHRRLHAARVAGMVEVPAYIKEYDSMEEAELDFLACNMQREKNQAVRIREFLAYKQMLCQLGKIRKGGGDWSATIYGNTHFSRILENVNIGDDEPLNSVDVLKEVTGYSEYEQTYLNVLYSPEWLQDKLDSLRNLGISLGLEQTLIENMEKARTAYENEEVTLNNAVKSIKDMFKDIKERLTKPKGEKKAKPEPKPKAEKVGKQKNLLEFAEHDLRNVFPKTGKDGFNEPMLKLFDFALEFNEGKIGLLRDAKGAVCAVSFAINAKDADILKELYS